MRYFFHLKNRTGEVRDEEGSELPDVAAARARALESIRAILSHELQEGRIDLAGHVDVLEAGGRQVLHVEFGEAVEILPARGLSDVAAP